MTRTQKHFTILAVLFLLGLILGLDSEWLGQLI